MGLDHIVAAASKGQDAGLLGGRPEIALPADASNNLFVEGLPSNCSRREVAHIIRPFIGYKEVRLVTKESRHEVPDNEFEKRVRPEVVPSNEIGVTFAEIGALDEIKESLQELVMLPLKRPNLFNGRLLKPCQGALQDLFVAGTDTTSNTLEWAMAELLRNPHTMVKAKDELKEVIGKGKIVEEKDLTKLPYLQCIVKETLRIHPPVPFLIPRRVDNQVNINGYTIPKGTQVLVNTWAIGRDPTIWENPLEFKPERFWNSKIDVQGQDFELIPFGAGRRICPGLPLAIRMIPLMLGSLLNNFNVNLDTEIRLEDLDMTERFGITLQKADPLCVFPVSLN